MQQPRFRYTNRAGTTEICPGQREAEQVNDTTYLPDIVVMYPQPSLKVNHRSYSADSWEKTQRGKKRNQQNILLTYNPKQTSGRTEQAGRQAGRHAARQIRQACSKANQAKQTPPAHTPHATPSTSLMRSHHNLHSSLSIKQEITIPFFYKTHQSTMEKKSCRNKTKPEPSASQ